ncbi:Nn.00g022510.m01.CDS01 [Neocucurbitaria sp. VM-36]
MGNHNPNLGGRSAVPLMNGHSFNPTANNFAPSGRNNKIQPQNNGSKPVSALPSSYIESRVLNLEEEHATLRGDVNTLKEMFHDLSFSVEKLKRGGWPVRVGPFQDVDLNKSHQSALEFKTELEMLGREVHQSVDNSADMLKVNDLAASTMNGSVSPHAPSSSVASNSTASKSLPPHLRGATKTEAKVMNGTRERSVDISPNNPLATDGPIDRNYREQKIPAAVPSPPASPTTVVDANTSSNAKELSADKAWKPHYLTTLPELPSDVLAKIPVETMVTFHPDFIHNTFDGVTWSPGLRFITGRGPCFLKNRTYYLLDPKTEPFLPKNPGEHGAKLTAFFNKAPEEEFGDLVQEGSSSYENVPMFIMVGNRYVYFGNYSQTRWSDKLDYDAMMAHVPQHVKESWASELTTTCREQWVTDELKNHFFKKPEYEGRLYTALDDEATVNSVEEVAIHEKMAKDVKKYIAELREWEREANMRVSMIKKDFILQAFERADADDPPALRLWWEYLQCVDWRKDFYDFLVTLQSRQPEQYLK